MGGTPNKGTPADKLPLVKSFLSYIVSKDGQAKLSQIGYGPLPDTLQTKVAASINNLA